MLMRLSVLVFAILCTQPAIADEGSKVLGVWKLVSYDLEFQDSGERRAVFGKSPKGYIIFTPEGRMMAYLEAETRQPPKTDEERIAAFRSIIAYTGKYRLDGDRWITKVDASWNVTWIGTDQERVFKFEGEQLHVISQWNRALAYDNRMVRGILVWEREK
jgi:hypothetical protein